MPLQTRAQVFGARSARGLACGDRHIDCGKRMLIQAEGLAREAFDAIPGDRRTEGTGSDRKPETRMGFMVRQH